MLMTEQDAKLAKDKSARCYVSVGPSGLVVSTGNENRGEVEGKWTGVVTVTDRMSGFSTHLAHSEALQLAASLVQASSFLSEEETPAQANEPLKLRCRS